MKIGVIGALGRMGQTVCASVEEHNEAELAAGLEREAGAKTHGITLVDDMDVVLEASDAIIDFSTPKLTIELAQKAAKAGVAHIIGTTGLNAEQESVLKEAGKNTRIVYAPNMSVGVNVLLALTEKVAATLGDEFDIEIVEMHHKHKVDAPSGTALGLGKAAAKGRDVALDDVACKSRDGITGERTAGEIGFATLRGGDVVGDHTVIFAGNGERIEVTHKASNRRIFADGAVRAALWTKNAENGLYSMQDVLGL